jgi:DNA topoisomerase-1
MAQIGAADDEEKKFASLMNDQNIKTYHIEEHKFILLPKNLRIIKTKEIEVSKPFLQGPYIRHGAALYKIETL